MALFMNEDSYRSLVDTLERAFAKIEPNDLARAISKVQPCAATGRLTGSEIAVALGEFGDIWPNSIRQDCETSTVIQFHRASRNDLF